MYAWGLTAKLPPEERPLLVDEEECVVLQGNYVLSMPCFELDAVYQYLLSRDEMIDDTVCVVTRSMKESPDTKKGRMAGLWSGDASRVLPQKNLNDQEKMILFHNRMGHIFCKKLVDAYMRMLYSGYSIPRSMVACLHAHGC